jgi:methyltransferase family protein
VQSKLFWRAVATFISLSAAGACAESAREPDKPDAAGPLIAQESTVVAAAQPTAGPAKTGAVQPTTAQQGKASVVPKPAKAGENTDDYKPLFGQEGKDVVWVPTPQPLVNKMLDMAHLTANDILFDLGSGDGRTVIAAAKRGATSTGVEFNPQMVALSKRIAQREGVGSKARFVQGDFFKTDFSKATVLTLFLMTDLNMKLRPTILDMKPGTRVVSNTFLMGDWTPDETESVSEKEGCTGYCTAHLWVVPARVQGTWRLPAGELTLTQLYQTVSGTLGGNPVSDATLRGDRVTFSAGTAQYSGRVNGRTFTGTVKSGSTSTPFTATRVGS